MEFENASEGVFGLRYLPGERSVAFVAGRKGRRSGAGEPKTAHAMLDNTQFGTPRTPAFFGIDTQILTTLVVDDSWCVSGCGRGECLRPVRLEKVSFSPQIREERRSATGLARLRVEAYEKTCTERVERRNHAKLWARARYLSLVQAAWVSRGLLWSVCISDLGKPRQVLTFDEFAGDGACEEETVEAGYGSVAGSGGSGSTATGDGNGDSGATTADDTTLTRIPDAHTTTTAATTSRMRCSIGDELRYDCNHGRDAWDTSWLGGGYCNGRPRKRKRVDSESRTERGASRRQLQGAGGVGKKPHDETFCLRPEGLHGANETRAHVQHALQGAELRQSVQALRACDRVQEVQATPGGTTRSEPGTARVLRDADENRNRCTSVVV